MSFLDRLEKRFRRYSITHITTYVVVGMIFFYVFSFIKPDIIGFFDYDAQMILKGEIWRLITFIFIPRSSNIIFLFFEVMFFYWVGNGLELEWGSFKFTLYYLGGIFGAVLATIIAGLFGGMEIYFSAYSVSSFFSMNLFIAFAWYYGNEEIRFMMIFPVKIKYLAILDVLIILQSFVFSTWGGRLVLFATMINLIVFYSVVLTKRAKSRARYVDFKVKTIKADKIKKIAARHRCAVCGRTEKTDPDMQFRFCSKCEGDYEFCEEHLRNHEHFEKVVEFKKPGDN